MSICFSFQKLNHCVSYFTKKLCAKGFREFKVSTFPFFAEECETITQNMWHYQTVPKLHVALFVVKSEGGTLPDTVV